MNIEDENIEDWLNDDDDDDDYQRSDYEIWYDDNCGYFRLSNDTWEFVDEDEVYPYYNSVYLPVMEELKINLPKLIEEQFPLCAAEMRPAFVEEINFWKARVGHSFLLTFFMLLRDFRNGTNYATSHADPYIERAKQQLKEEAEDMEMNINLDFLKNVPNLTPDQIQQITDALYEEHLKATNYKLWRTQQFRRVMQTALLKHYPRLLDLNNHQMLYYIHGLDVEAFDYQLTMEDYESLIEYGFTEEDLKKGYKEVRMELQERIREKYRKLSEEWDNKEKINN